MVNNIKKNGPHESAVLTKGLPARVRERSGASGRGLGSTAHAVPVLDPHNPSRATGRTRLFGSKAAATRAWPAEAANGRADDRTFSTTSG